MSLLALSGCSLTDDASYRFRMTVEVQTPEGLKRGSSVFEEVARRWGFKTSETGDGRGITLGEAVAVDLSSGPIFVLLSLPNSEGELGGYATQALAKSKRFTDFADYFAAVRKLGGWLSSAKAELPREHWPIMVRFADPQLSQTVEAVDPQVLGVTRIILKTTSSNVTTGIRARLPWLGRGPESSLNPDHSPYDSSLAATLHEVDFVNR